jgi:hypothetical protein
LDNDGVFEIVSIGWNQYQQIHLWKKATPDFGGRRAEAKSKVTATEIGLIRTKQSNKAQ